MPQGQDGRASKRKKKQQKTNESRSKLARPRQALPRGRPEPGQWPCTQILWDKPYWQQVMLTLSNSFFFSPSDKCERLIQLSVHIYRIGKKRKGVWLEWSRQERIFDLKSHVVLNAMREHRESHNNQKSQQEPSLKPIRVSNTGGRATFWNRVFHFVDLLYPPRLPPWNEK